MNFERTSRRKIADLNLTPLIDVLFILIIFFMLTTSFMRIESMELVLPSAGGKAAQSKDVVHIYLYENGDMTLGLRKLDQDELNASLTRMFEKDPATRVMLLTADGVSIQQLVNVMDRIYLTGARSLFVRKWVQQGAGGN